MVSIFTGLGSGFERGSAAQLGSAGLLGAGTLGRNGEQLSLNAATGNLLIRQQDEFLVGRGQDASVSRTYNSLGDPTHDDNGDRWQQSTDRRVYGLTGTLNTTGSTVKRLSGDGSEITYTWNSTASAYVATDGAGAYDKLVQSGSGSTTAWTWTDGDSQIVETYSAYDPAHPSAPTTWRITSQADTSGNTLSYSYVTSSSRLDRITTQNGEYIAYSWDGSGNITDVVTHYDTSNASTSTRTHYAYTSNKLTSVTVDLTPDDNSVADGAKYVTTYAYDSNGRVSSISETDGSSMAVGYDGSGRVTSLTQTVATGVTRVTSIAYYTGYTTITDPLSQVTRLDYDSNNRLTKITVPAGVSGGTAQVTQFGYDANDNVTDVTDLTYSPNKNIHYDYDSSGNVLRVTDPLGNVVTRTYDSHNHVLTETTTPAGTTSGNLGPSLLPNYTYWGGNETAGAGTLTNGAPAYYYTGTSSGLTLQSVGVSVTAGDTITYELTLKAGTTSDAAAVDTSSGASSVTIVTGPGTVTNGTSGSWADISGLSTTAETRIRVTRTVTTSGLDYLYFIAGASTLSGSARAGLTIVVGDPSIVRTTPAAAAIQPTTRYTYDSNNRLEYTVSAEGRVTHHSYDANGNDTADQIYVGGHYDVSALANSAALTSTQIATWVSGLSDKTQFQNIERTYDARGNLSIETEYSASTTGGLKDTSGGNKQTTYVYDQRGQLRSRHVNGLATEYFLYDGLGRITTSTDLNGATTHFVFNDSATQTVVTYANGLVETSTYNKAGELLNTTDSLDPPTTSANLAPNLNGAGQWLGNQTSGTPKTLASGGTAYEYTGPSSGLTLQSYGVSLNAGDTLTYQLTLLAGSATSVLTMGVSSGDNSDTVYSIAGAGSLSVSGGAATVSGLSTTSETRVTITRHATTADTEWLYFWVASGQTVFVGDPSIVKTTAVAPRFQYDADGQLRIATDKTGKSSYFVYDHAGRKVADVDQDGDMIEYVYDGDDRLVETIHYASQLTSTQLATVANASASFELSSVRPGTNAGDLKTWKVYDADGRVIEVIDGTGDVTTYAYDGFGRLVTTTGYATKLTTLPSTPPTSLLLPTADTAHDSVSRIFYDKDGLVVGTLNGEGYVTKTDYDDAGQKITETAFAGQVTSSTTRATGTFADLLTVAGTSSSSDRVTHYAYNDQGQLRFVVDALGHVTEYGYRSGTDAGSEIGDVRTVTQYANLPYPTPGTYTVAAIQAVLHPSTTDDRVSYAVYDAHNRLTYAIDATGAVTNYNYDSLGQLIKTTQFAKLCTTPSVDLATMTSWQADSTHLSSDDRVTRSYFDLRGRIKYTVDGEGYLTRYDYDAENRITGTTRWYSAVSVSDTTTTATLTEPSTGGSTSTATTYDNEGRVATVTEGIGTGSTGVTTAYHYNANGTLDWVKVAPGTSDEVQTKYTYDNAGRKATQTDAFGATEARVTSYGYDGLGDLVSVADADGNTSYSYYNKLGQLTTSRDALGYVTELAYNAFGEAVSATRRANVATNAASANALPVYSADAAHDATSYSYYDKLGRVKLTRDAEDYVTETVYTAFGEIDTITRRANKTASTPDVATEPTVSPDPTHDAVTNFTYDKLGRVKRITDPEIDPAVSGGTTHSYEEYSYTAFGQKLTVRNRLGATTTNTYDHRGLLTQEVLPISAVRADGTTEASSVTNKFEYDARGNRTKMTEAYGLAEQRITIYKYDLLDRLIETDLPTVRNSTDTADVNPVEYISYDARGNVIEKKDALNTRTLFYYDKLGRVTDSIGPTGTYSKITFALGAGINGGVQTSRTYDTQVTLPTTAGGTPPGAPSGTYRETIYTYDKLGRLQDTKMSSVRTGSWNTATSVYSTSVVGTLTLSHLDYDAFGNVIKATDGTGAVTFSYYDRAGHQIAQVDALNYLTLYYAKDGSGNPVYTRDAAGNVLFETRYATAITGTFDATTSVATLKSLHDSAATAAGDTGAKDRTTAFTYDRDGNRLTEARTGLDYYTINTTTGALTQVSGGTATITYTYNAIGQVLTKTEATGDAVTYTYDSAGRLTVESRTAYLDQTGTSVTPTVRYFYDGLGNLTRTTQGGATVGSGDRVTSYTYGKGGRLASMTDPAGYVHTYYYDQVGNKVGEAYDRLKADGTTTVHEGISYQYDAAGHMTRQAFATVSSGVFTDAGDVTTLSYNAHGEVTSRSLNGVTQEQYHYDNAGHLDASNSGNGAWKYFIYDANGNQTAELDDEGKTGVNLINQSLSTVIGIATAGNTTTIGATYIDGINATVTAYDARNQATTSVQTKRQLTESGTPVNLTSSRTYNAFGEVRTETDALSHTTTYTYNVVGKAVTVQHATVNYETTAGSFSSITPTETYYYDKSGRLIGQQDANSRLTSRLLLAGTGYGQATALIAKEFHPDTGLVQNSYDLFGDQRGQVDEIGRSTTMVYDALGRVSQVNHAGGLVDNYVYDVLGQRTRHTRTWNNGGTTQVDLEKTDYDVQGRVITQIAFGGDTTTTSYSWSGTLVTTGMNGGTAFGGHTQTTTYANSKTIVEATDGFGHIVSHTDMGGNTTNVSYDTAGRLVERAGGDTQRYSYLNTGLAGSVSSGTGTGTGYTETAHASYGYDAVGEKLTEQATSAGKTIENATATYDAVGRMLTWTEAGTALSGTSASISPYASVTWSYDAAGNIRHESESFSYLRGDGAVLSTGTQSFWYSYDEMNRVLTDRGTLSGSTVVRGTTGVDLTYDKAGQRHTVTSDQYLTGQASVWVWYPDYDPATGHALSPMDEGVTGEYQLQDRTYSGQRVETYSYNDAGNLTSAAITVTNYTDAGGGTLTPTGVVNLSAGGGTYTYDQLGRQIRQIDIDRKGRTALDHTTHYDSKGRVDTETSVQFLNASSTYVGDTYTTTVTNTFGDGTSAYALGAVITSTTSGYKLTYGASTTTSIPTTSTATTYDWYDGAVQKTVTYTPDTSSSGTYYTTTYTNSGSGLLLSAHIADGRTRDVTVTSDALGQAVRRDEEDGIAYNTTTFQGGDPHQVWYRFNGKQIGSTGNDSTYDTSYAGSLDDREHVVWGGNGAFRYGMEGGLAYAEFNDRLTQINTYNQGTSGGTYTVRAGDTLSSIAAQLWGDSSLWYKLAEANGLSSDTGLAVGRTIVVPSGIINNSNNSSISKPYDASLAYGDTAPTTPQPQKASNKCGIFGQILLVVIAVAVTVASQGTLAAWTGSQVIGGALAAAAGSVVSQAVGVATGIQDNFSWKGVALAAIGGAVGGALQGVKVLKDLSSLTKFGGDVVRGALGSAITQGIGVATGLQDKFDWAGVAAAGIGAGVGNAFARNVLHVDPTATAHNLAGYTAQAVTATVNAIANAATRSLLEGSDFGDNLVAALPDVIGSTIGNFVGNQAAGALAAHGKTDESDAKANSKAANKNSGAIAPGNQAPAIVSVTAGVGGGEFDPDFNIGGRNLLAEWGFERFLLGGPAAGPETVRVRNVDTGSMEEVGKGIGRVPESGRFTVWTDDSHTAVREGTESDRAQEFANQAFNDAINNGLTSGPYADGYVFNNPPIDTAGEINANLEVSSATQDTYENTYQVPSAWDNFKTNLYNTFFTSPAPQYRDFDMGSREGRQAYVQAATEHIESGVRNSGVLMMTVVQANRPSLRGGLLGEISTVSRISAAERMPTIAGPTGKAYSVAFETKLDASVWGKSDSVHFNRANAALDDALRSDPVWAAQMEEMIPGVQGSVAKAGGRATPEGWVWHHDVEPGTMQLSPTNQHWDPKFWNTFHPDNKGGYAIWARPAGAPPRK